MADRGQLDLDPEISIFVEIKIALDRHVAQGADAEIVAANRCDRGRPAEIACLDERYTIEIRIADIPFGKAADSQPVFATHQQKVPQREPYDIRHPVHAELGTGTADRLVPDRVGHRRAATVEPDPQRR